MAATASTKPHDYHRAQIESWLRANTDKFASPVLDIGCGRMRRDWIAKYAEYVTVDRRWCKPDVEVDVEDLSVIYEKSAGTVICTEVLEHVRNPFMVIEQIRKILDGWLFVTSPFLWVWHGTPNYPDYWRFTHQAWELLLEGFKDVTIEPVKLADEENFLQFGASEAMWIHNLRQVKFTTGYLCTART